MRISNHLSRSRPSKYALVTLEPEDKPSGPPSVTLFVIKRSIRA